MITTVEGVQQAREKCEQSINTILRSFEEATGLKVYAIISDYVSTEGAAMVTNSKMDVRI